MKIGNLDIKPANVRQVQLILDFIREIAEYEKLVHEVVADKKTLRNTLFGKNKSAEVVIGYCQGKPVGYALFFYNYSSFIGRHGLYIEDIYIKPEHRGKGYGKAFMVYLARIARDKKCGRMEWAVLTWNEPSIKFYKKLGAVSMDDWRIFRLSGDALKKLETQQLDYDW
jgi:GNAT superfamily N-acetyltransferase